MNKNALHRALFRLTRLDIKSKSTACTPASDNFETAYQQACFHVMEMLQENLDTLTTAL